MAQYKPEVRPVLVLLSDGNDTISPASRGECLNQLMASGAVLYALSPNPEVATGAALTQIAESNGGRVLPWRNKDLLQNILAEQRASYVVTYALPSRQKGFPSLRILPKHNLNAHGRLLARTSWVHHDIRRTTVRHTTGFLPGIHAGF